MCLSRLRLQELYCYCSLIHGLGFYEIIGCTDISSALHRGFRCVFKLALLTCQGFREYSFQFSILHKFISGALKVL